MFEGFSPESVDFLWGIRMNNNRDWFLEHKKLYTDTLYTPMKELGQELFAPFLDKPGNILKVSRIYRDARLHHPDPYKESLWICIRQDVQWWAENPCLYFEINPEGVDYGFFYWHPRTATMEDFRRQITAKPDEFLSMIAGVEAAAGQKVEADCYKRPKPCENPDLLPYFAWKGQIGCTRHEDFGEGVFSPELSRRVRVFFEQLIPLYDYFNRFKV
ncbi:MAG: DUF2461 domain-containing protein [Faecousia sp.]